METKIKLAILGDVCPTADYAQLFASQTVLTELLPVIRDADYAICNLECPATYHTVPIRKTGPNLRANPDCLDMLKAAGIGAIAMANNHVLDYGEQGVLDTLEGARRVGLSHFGGGTDKKTAAEPLVVEIQGKKIAFLAFAEHEFNLATETSPGANWMDPYVSLGQIARAKERCDYVVVLYHGGIEHYIYPSPLLQKKCRAMVDAGADGVFCQHSHCIGTMETYQNRPIVYGQGNTVFGYRKNNDPWNEGLAFTLVLTGDQVALEPQLLLAQPEGIRRADAAQTQQRLQQWHRNSQCLGDTNAIREHWEAFCEKNQALVMPNYFGRSRLFNKLNRLLNNALIRLFVGRDRHLVSLAYLRCEAHHEVVQTILEKESK